MAAISTFQEKFSWSGLGAEIMVNRRRKAGVCGFESRRFRFRISIVWRENVKKLISFVKDLLAFFLTDLPPELDESHVKTRYAM